MECGVRHVQARTQRETSCVLPTICESRLFKEVLQGKGAGFNCPNRCSAPTFTVDLEAGWSLTSASDRVVLLRKVIKTSGTATMGEAFVGMTRLRLAAGAAARSNIQQGLADIAALDLRP